MTLTTFFMPNGSRGMSTHGILERSGYFGEAFTTRAKQIFNKYYPIEVDPSIDIATKSAAMSEWCVSNPLMRGRSLLFRTIILRLHVCTCGINFCDIDAATIETAATDWFASNTL